MTISQCLYFSFDNIPSTQFNILNCHIDSGMYSEPFMAQRTLIEQKIRGRSPYLQEVQREPLQFSVTFAFPYDWNKDILRQVAQWLDVNFYKPLVFYDSTEPDGTELIYYAMPIDASQIVHNGNNTGYITIQFKCSSPHAYSPVYLSASNTIYEYFFYPGQPAMVAQKVQITNDGDIPIRPILIVKTFASDFRITNLTNGGKKLHFSKLVHDETLEIDLENELISSDISNTTYRYNNLSDDSDLSSFQLVTGVNTLSCEGNFQFQIKYELAYITN